MGGWKKSWPKGRNSGRFFVGYIFCTLCVHSVAYIPTTSTANICMLRIAKTQENNISLCAHPAHTLCERGVHSVCTFYTLCAHFGSVLNLYTLCVHSACTVYTLRIHLVNILCTFCTHRVCTVCALCGALCCCDLY